MMSQRRSFLRIGFLISPSHIEKLNEPGEMRQLMPPRHHKAPKPAEAYIFDDPDRSGKSDRQAGKQVRSFRQQILQEFRNQRTDLLVVYLRNIGLNNVSIHSNEWRHSRRNMPVGSTYSKLKTKQFRFVYEPSPFRNFYR